MTSVFQVLAHEDNNDQSIMRKAAALATRRVEDRFGAFVRQGSVEDRNARLSLVQEDVRAVVATACEEIGYSDANSINHIILNSFVTPEESARVETQRIASIHESRKPKMCPYHSEVTDISLAQGEPQAGFNAMAQHAWTSQHCQGSDYEGGKCNFKPAMTTQAFWDEKAEKAEERKRERDEQAELQAEQEATALQDQGDEGNFPEGPVDDEGNVELEDALGGFGEPVGGGEATAPEAEVPMSMAASAPKDSGVHVADYQYVKKQGDKWVILQKGTGKVLSHHDSEEEAKAAFRAMMANKHGSIHTADAGPNVVEGQGVPSPKMDKRKWTPQTVPSMPPGTDSKKNPTKRKDIVKPIVAEDADALKEIGEQTTERQDVTQKGGPAKTQQGGSWTEGPKTAISSEEVREIIAKYRGK